MLLMMVLVILILLDHPEDTQPELQYVLFNLG